MKSYCSLPPRPLLAAMLGIAIWSFSLSGHAIGLGAAQVSSGIGQPLRVKVPVLADASEAVGGEECFRLVQPRHSEGDLPVLSRADIKLVQGTQGKYLMLTTRHPVNDPALDFSLESVCDNALRRDYTVLLDTVPDPAGATDAAPVSVAPMPAQAVLSEAASAAAMSARRVRRGAVARHRSSRPAPVKAARKQTTAAVSAPRRKVARASTDPVAATAAGSDVALHISTGLSLETGQRRLIPDSSQAQAQPNSDAGRIQADDLHDDIAALQKQLAEARSAVAMLHKQIAAESASPIPATPTLGLARLDSAGWPVWFMYPMSALALAAGAASLYLLRKQRRSGRLHHAAGLASVDTAECWTEAAWMKPRETVEQVEAGGIDQLAQPPAPAPLRAVNLRVVPRMDRQKDDFLVSTVNQITEEATVFAHLGYPERAMTLLAEHIAGHEHSHPAAWYMLFDLYRENGQRAEFEQAQVAFGRRFNLAAPAWQASMESENDSVDVLSFPHVLERIAQLWPAVGCRVYLEGLLYDDRGGERQGFSRQTYHDLLFLIALLEVVHPSETPQSGPELTASGEQLCLLQGAG